MGLGRFRTPIYAKDPTFLLEESVAKGAKKDPKHVQTTCSFNLIKELGWIDEG